MRRVGKNSIEYNNVYLLESSTISGPREKNAQLGKFIDKSYNELSCSEKTWEKAEIKLQNEAFLLALEKANLKSEDIGLILSGDLNNQIIASSYMARKFNIPHIGLYGACSTAVLSIIVGANYIESNIFDNVACLTSSHYATSERQFRFPTEYGGQKPSSTTTTVTGSGCSLLSTKKSNIKVTRATIGKVVDPNYKDVQDLGRAMAPAAAMTLRQHFDDFNVDASEYDLILTGDLSECGSIVFKDILKEWGIEFYNYNDCGLMIYDRKVQEVFSGGSGCGCCSLILNGYIKEMLSTKKLNKVLIIATGALMNPLLAQQKESIPGIAHAIVLESVME